MQYLTSSGNTSNRCRLHLVENSGGDQPTQLTGWNRQAKEGMVAAFSGKSANVQNNAAAEIRKLHTKIDELTVEKDFLGRAFAKGKVHQPVYRLYSRS